MQRVWWNACWCAGLVAAVVFCLHAVPAFADERARETLERVAEAYEEIRLIGAELVNGAPPHTQRIQVVTRRDGDYAARYRKEDVPRGRVASEKPDYYVFQSSGKFFSATDVSQGYTGLSLVSDPMDPRKAAAHHLLAPWPYVGPWARLLLDAADTVYTSEGDLFTASSASVGLALTWNETPQIVRIVIHRTDGGLTTMTFGSFDTRTRLGLPTSVHLRTASSEAVDAHTAESFSTYTQIRVNRPADEELLPFDPVALGVYRFDPGTGNVYNHDGSLRYNEHAFLRQAGFPASGTRIHTAWWMVLIVAGFGSGWVGYRKVRTRGTEVPGGRGTGYAMALGRVLVGLCLLLAAIAKLSTVVDVEGGPVEGVGAFAAGLERQGVIPASLVGLVALLVIGLELLMGIALLVHQRVRVVSKAALGFIVLVSVYMGLAWIVRGNVASGWFGILTGDRISGSLGWNLGAACLLAPSVIWKSR